jgi:hypothetical protein
MECLAATFFDFMMQVFCEDADFFGTNTGSGLWSRFITSATVAGRAIQSEWWESRRQPKDKTLKIRVPGSLFSII